MSFDDRQVSGFDYHDLLVLGRVYLREHLGRGEPIPDDEELGAFVADEAAEAWVQLLRGGARG